MSIVHGKNITLSWLDSAEYKILGGMRVTDMILESNYVRSNAASDTDWEELSPVPTSRSLKLSGEGIFYTENSEHQFAHLAYDGNHVRMKLSCDEAQSIEGLFAIERYSYQSNARSPLTFSMIIKSSGDVIFT